MQNQQKTISSHGQVKCFWIKHKLDHKSGLGKFKIIKIYQVFFLPKYYLSFVGWGAKQKTNKHTNIKNKEQTEKHGYIEAYVYNFSWPRNQWRNQRDNIYIHTNQWQ